MGTTQVIEDDFGQNMTKQKTPKKRRFRFRKLFRLNKYKHLGSAEQIDLPDTDINDAVDTNGVDTITSDTVISDKVTLDKTKDSTKCSIEEQKEICSISVTDAEKQSPWKSVPHVEYANTAMVNDNSADPWSVEFDSLEDLDRPSPVLAVTEQAQTSTHKRKFYSSSNQQSLLDFDIIGGEIEEDEKVERDSMSSPKEKKKRTKKKKLKSPRRVCYNKDEGLLQSDGEDAEEPVDIEQNDVNVIEVTIEEGGETKKTKKSKKKSKRRRSKKKRAKQVS